MIILLLTIYKITMNTRVLRRRFNNNDIRVPSVILYDLDSTVRSITINGVAATIQNRQCEVKFDGPQDKVTIVTSTNDYYRHDWEIEGACSSHDVQGPNGSETIILNNVFGVVKIYHSSWIK